jgi:SAM-dependent methyltransferase
MKSPAQNRPPNFNPLARLYLAMEALTFGPFLALCRTTFLRDAAEARRALVLGDGDGRFTARLLRVNPNIQVHAIDASSAMLAALTRRARPHAARLSTDQADLRTWEPALPEVYELFATHFFLDCLTTEEVQSLALKLRRIAAPSALWLVSDFAIPQGLFGALIARPIVAALYLVFGLLTGLQVRTLPDHSTALRAAGFSLLHRRKRLGGLLVSELWVGQGGNGAISAQELVAALPNNCGPSLIDTNARESFLRQYQIVTNVLISFLPEQRGSMRFASSKHNQLQIRLEIRGHLPPDRSP